MDTITAKLAIGATYVNKYDPTSVVRITALPRIYNGITALIPFKGGVEYRYLSHGNPYVCCTTATSDVSFFRSTYKLIKEVQ